VPSSPQSDTTVRTEPRIHLLPQVAVARRAAPVTERKHPCPHNKEQERCNDYQTWHPWRLAA
jgi:hypothetical protein